MQKYVNLVNLVDLAFQRVFPCKLGVDTAENESLEVIQFIFSFAYLFLFECGIPHIDIMKISTLYLDTISKIVETKK